MPDSRISALPSATSPLAGTEVLPIVQSGTTDKVTAADLLRQSGQTVTTSNPVLSLAQTWNAGGVTFTGAVINITDTASATSSHYFKVQNAGTDVFSIYKQASSLVGMRLNDTAGAPRFTVSSNGGQTLVQLASSAGNNGYLSSDGSNNTVALQFGTNAQTFNVYSTFTDTSNYERLFVSGSVASEFTIVAQRAGTGTNRALNIGTYTAAALKFMTSGTGRWSVGTTGHITADTDNTLDIGASGATRPRTVYTGTSFVAPDGSDASPSFTFGVSQTGMYRDSGGGRIRFAVGGAFGVSIASGGIGLASDTAFIQMGQSSDVVLNRDAAQTLAQRNGTNAQAFRVYNTYTDASNYERGSIGWSANVLTISAENAGTGGNRGVSIIGKAQVLLESTLSSVFFRTSGNNRWNVDPSGHFLAAVDNIHDIGASGATRPRSVYVGSNIVTGTQIQAGSFITAGNGTYIGITSSFFMDSASSGVVAIKNWAGTDFSRLQFGGTTSSFPSLKRSGTEIQVRLADDSGDATLTAGTLKSGGSALIGVGTAIPAGGNNGIGFKGTSATNFGVFFGSGAPTLSAAKGSLYLRSDGSGATDRFYINTDGGTTWTAGTTVL